MKLIGERKFSKICADKILMGLLRVNHQPDKDRILGLIPNLLDGLEYLTCDGLTLIELKQNIQGGI